MFITRILFLLFVFTSLSGNSQVQDTLQYAQEQVEQKDLAEGDRILSLYNKSHQDIYGLWLQAQVAFWLGDTDRSIDLYQRAYHINPELADLKLDYARVLFNSGKLKLAEPILTEYLEIYPSHPETLLLLGYIDFWNGKTARAKNRAKQVLEDNPGNELSEELLKEIKVITAPFVALNSAFSSDDQPLESKTYAVSLGKYHSRFLSPLLNAGLKDFTLPEQTVQSYYFEGGNKFTLGSSGTEITILGGIFKPDNTKDETEFTGKLLLSQKLAKHFFLDLNTTRIPYQYTLASIEQLLMHSVSSAGLRLDNPEKIIGKIAYERQVFPDENIIHTSYAYLLKSIINSNAFRFDLGYSFNYAHSDNNTFRPAEPVGPNTELNTQLEGVYDPYFTPRNQMVNSLLGSVRLTPAKLLEVKIRANYGFYARADNPFLMATTGNPGNAGKTEKLFGEISYTPVEVFGEFKINISEGFALGGNYQYSRLLFYEYHQTGVSLNYSFL